MKKSVLFIAVFFIFFSFTQIEAQEREKKEVIITQNGDYKISNVQEILKVSFMEELSVEKNLRIMKKGIDTLKYYTFTRKGFYRYYDNDLVAKYFPEEGKVKVLKHLPQEKIFSWEIIFGLFLNFISLLFLIKLMKQYEIINGKYIYYILIKTIIVIVLSVIIFLFSPTALEIFLAISLLSIVLSVFAAIDGEKYKNLIFLIGIFHFILIAMILFTAINNIWTIVLLPFPFYFILSKIK